MYINKNFEVSQSFVENCINIPHTNNRIYVLFNWDKMKIIGVYQNIDDIMSGRIGFKNDVLLTIKSDLKGVNQLHAIRITPMCTIELFLNNYKIEGYNGWVDVSTNLTTCVW